MSTYSVKMASGDTFTWSGEPGSTNWDTTAGFLMLAGGTLVNLRHIESMTPIGTTEPEVESP